MLFATALQIGREAVTSILSLMVGAIALVLMLRTRVSPMWLIIGSALLGLAVRR